MKKLSIIIIFFLLFIFTSAFSGISLSTFSGEKRGILIPKGEVDFSVKTFKGTSLASVSFSPDGRYIAFGDWKTIKIWNINTGKEVRTFKGHTLPVNSVSFSPDGRYIVSGSDDCTIKLWDITTGKELRTFKGLFGNILAVSFSPDGKYIVSGSFDGILKLWDINTGKEIRNFKGHLGSRINSVSFSPDGRYLATGGGGRAGSLITIWDTKTGKILKTWEGHNIDTFSVSFSPDGRYIVSGGDDSTIKLWDVNTGKEVRTFKGHNDAVRSVSFSPDGRYIASGSVDKTIKFWDVNTGKEIRTLIGHSEGVISVSFSPDGRFIASGSWDGTIKLWDLQFLALELKIPEKDPFETTKEYEARVQRYREEFKERVSAFQLPYNKEITLKPENYNADAGGFEIKFYGNWLFIPVPRERAKELVKRPVKITGILRYYDEKYFILTEASIIDEVTNEKYVIYLLDR